MVQMGHVFKPQKRMITDVVQLSDLKSVHPEEKLWIFGYGSILWKTGFEYSNKVVGHVNGFVRKFWQGNVTHRGTPEMPGRVATLIERTQGLVWGEAFEVVGSQITKALEHLGMRECLLGGYDILFVSFHPRDNPEVTIPALVFNASQENPYYIGKTPLDVMAHEVVDAEGASGHNVEYVIRLAEYLRQFIPEDQDDHLFGLESHVLKILEARGICKDRLVKAASKRTHLYRRDNKVNKQDSVKRRSTVTVIPIDFQAIGYLNNMYNNSYNEAKEESKEKQEESLDTNRRRSKNQRVLSA